MDERLRGIGKFLLVLFLLYAVLHNPDFVALSLRAAWSFLSALLSSLGRVVDTL